MITLPATQPSAKLADLVLVGILTCKPAAVQRINSGHRCVDVRTLDVDVALGGGFVDVDVRHAAVLVALLHHVISDLLQKQELRLHISIIYRQTCPNTSDTI